MHALLFEVEPRVGHEEHYFKHAARLRPLLDAHTGMLFIDRFKSLMRPGIVLSHSIWRDEASLAKWRTDAQHHRSQTAGRQKHFKDYRIRISHVLAYHVPGKAMSTWSNEGAYLDPSSANPRFLTIIATLGDPFPDADEAFRSVNIDNAFLSIRSFDTETECTALLSKAGEAGNVTRAMSALVSRDYGMFRREEAPQYFPSVSAIE